MEIQRGSISIKIYLWKSESKRKKVQKEEAFGAFPIKSEFVCKEESLLILFLTEEAEY